MIYTTTITKSGQISLPKSVREFLGLNLGDRITFSLKKDTVSIKKVKPLEEVLKEIDANKSEETKALIKKYAGKTTNELREIFDNSPEGKKYYKEKYGITF